MAQSGFTPISQYYSTTAAAVPTAGNLVNGELALNITDGKIFYKDNAGAVQVIGTKGGVGTSSTTQVLYNSSGLVVGSANLTFNGTTLTVANDASISGLTVGKGGGTNGTVLGYQAGYTNATGTGLTAFGYQAGYFSTLGNNTFLGNGAGYSVSIGQYNTYVGEYAGYNATTGTRNTFLGRDSGYAITTGQRNTIIGRYDGNTGGLDIRTASNYIVLSDGDGNPRGIFDNAGKFLVGRTASGLSNTTGVTIGDGGIGLQSEGNTVQIYLNRTTSDGVITSFRRNNTEVGSIAVTTVLTTYNTTSDYRLKTVIAPVIDAGQRLDALKPIEYDWKVGGRTRGFLAHQFAEVYPTSVSGEKDAVDEDGKPVYQAMQASTPEVMADLVAEIQSLRKRVALLESK